VRVVIFCHSLLSDWNHGNAHFLRGVVSELLARGHDVRVFEPEDAWSVVNLVAEHGSWPIDAFHEAYPELKPIRYTSGSLDLSDALNGADLVIVHEWNDPGLVAAIGRHRAGTVRSASDEGRGGNYVLLFHDTHHRSVTSPGEIGAYDLTHYDGVLAFGDPIRDAYLRHGWASQVWTWHEAADVRRFHPRAADRVAALERRPAYVPPRDGGSTEVAGDLVWIGNWGDEERSAELLEFLIEPVRRLGIRARVYGVRYPEHARRALADAGIEYGGWLPNYRVPEVFAAFRLTIHVPRSPYVMALPGIPTIRPFEALACGIPLVVALWDTAEELFTPGADFLFARTGVEMERQIGRVLTDASLRERLARHGLSTIRSRHTCAHRVDELLAIVAEIRTHARTTVARESVA
jgi:spore maturation protein CgeB